MEFPFFSNYWNNNPRHHWLDEETPAMNPHHWARGGVESPAAMNREQTRSPFPRQVETPVVNRQTGMEIPAATVKSRGGRSQQLPPKAASKVVDIPVRFVGSGKPETMKAETAAVKIQKVFRGLLVRKSVNKIAGIRKEVDEIEKKVSEKETILLLRRDAKERLKVNELLMKLLLQLDSIRGVDSGIRVFRKSVIKKAIMLQERVDEIVSGGDVDMLDTNETVQEEEEECAAAADSLEPVAEVIDQTVETKCSENVVDEDTKADDHVDVIDQTVETKCSENVVDEDTKADDHVDDSHGYYEAMVEAPADHTSELHHVSIGDVETTDKFDTVSDIEDENLKEEEEVDMMDIHQPSELIQAENQNEDSTSLGVVEGGGDKKVAEEENGNINRDLMERMIKGNEMLTGLVAELCERQESQTRLLSSLSQRVENLEKAFRCERSKRSKKKRNNNINKL